MKSIKPSNKKVMIIKETSPYCKEIKINRKPSNLDSTKRPFIVK